ncbi:hypothetical protein [Polaromonas sp.]|uniref:hypothetical protein n=1 Tax=Polaromonas sp. TaxID=1869339 RepID=UPI00286A9362|nr:hypothetical protein [Polaromonas sp.]
MTPASPLHRRRFFATLAGGLGLPALLQPSLALAKDSRLPTPASLPQAARAAAAQGEPLLLLVSLPGCPYCELVRRNYLLPMRQQQGLHAWQLSLSDRGSALTGFDGNPTSPAAQISAWQAGFTPTLLFLGPQGQELAERLVGVAVPDFYGAYLQDRLVSARQAFSVRPV